MGYEQQIREILKAERLAPSKKLGQNFLVHRQTAEKIVRLAGVTKDDTVIELGVGLGALTDPLATAAGQVIGLEIDAGIIRYHQEQQHLPSNVDIRHQDLLTADFHALASHTGQRLKMVANLPYSISNPLLFKLIENRADMAWAVLMLQKEVGQRLTAQVGSKEYGVLTVLLGACAQVEQLMELGPGQFHPRPKVDSVVVRISFFPPPPEVNALPDYDRKLFTRLVKSGFQQRRKTLLNALSSSPLRGFDRATVAAALDAADIPSASRAEKLSLQDFVRLTNSFPRQTG